VIPGTPSTQPPQPEDPRVTRALEDFQALLEQGQQPNRQEFLARYPEVAASLADCLEALEAVIQVAPQLHSRLAPVQLEVALGDFHVTREIGRGGMGVVYEAVQLSLGRKVALKVLPMAAALDGKQLQRFKNEAQAAAHLHHTNIVPVYAVGCERGVH
jgi:serine/threonine protein kinase